MASSSGTTSAGSKGISIFCFECELLLSQPCPFGQNYRLGQRAEVACTPIFREKSGGKYVRGSHSPPAEARFSAWSRHVNAFKKGSQLGRRSELRNGFQSLEGRRERVRQAPHLPRRELLILRIEVVIVHHSGQVLGCLKFSLDECPINYELRGFIRKLAAAPSLDLPAHRLEAALQAVNADGNAVLQSEVLRMFR